jgi:hypothetical protein
MFSNCLRNNLNDVHKVTHKLKKLKAVEPEGEEEL